MKDNKLIADFMELEVDNGLYCYTTAIDDYKTDTLYFVVTFIKCIRFSETYFMTQW